MRLGCLTKSVISSRKKEKDAVSESSCFLWIWDVGVQKGSDSPFLYNVIPLSVVMYSSTTSSFFVIGFDI